MEKVPLSGLHYWSIEQSKGIPKRERSQSSLLYKEAKKLGLLQSPVLRQYFFYVVSNNLKPFRPTKSPPMPIEPLELPPLEELPEPAVENIDFSEDSSSSDRHS